MKTIHETDIEATPSGSKPVPSTVFGFLIGVMPDGRRLWSPKFKHHIISLLSEGEYNIAQIAEECDVKEALVTQWEQDVSLSSKTVGNNSKPQITISDGLPAFAELEIDDFDIETFTSSQMEQAIIIKTPTLEMSLPTNYPPTSLALIVRELNTTI
jgi:transposase-like protein